MDRIVTGATAPRPWSDPTGQLISAAIRLTGHPGTSHEGKLRTANGRSLCSGTAAAGYNNTPIREVSQDMFPDRGRGCWCYNVVVTAIVSAAPVGRHTSA